MIALCFQCDTVSVMNPRATNRPAQLTAFRHLTAQPMPSEILHRSHSGCLSRDMVLWERGASDRLIHYDLDPRASQGL
jgi:hypothetical protein